METAIILNASTLHDIWVVCETKCKKSGRKCSQFAWNGSVNRVGEEDYSLANDKMDVFSFEVRFCGEKVGNGQGNYDKRFYHSWMSYSMNDRRLMGVIFGSGFPPQHLALNKRGCCNFLGRKQINPLHFILEIWPKYLSRGQMCLRGLCKIN